MTEIQQRELHDLKSLDDLLKSNGYVFFGPFGTDNKTHIDDRSFFKIYQENNGHLLGEIVLFDLNQRVPHKVEGKYRHVIVRYEIERPYQTAAALNLRKLLRTNNIPYRESPNETELHRIERDLGLKILTVKNLLYKRSQ